MYSHSYKASPPLTGQYISFPDPFISCIPFKPPKQRGPQHQNQITFSRRKKKKRIFQKGVSLIGGDHPCCSIGGPTQSKIANFFLDCEC